MEKTTFHSHQINSIEGKAAAFDRLLQKRFSSQKQIDEFFSWSLKELPNLESLNDLEKAAARIIQAMEEEQTIGLYGDYDVDGTTSCALLFHFFKALNYPHIEMFQPSRFVEGYGIHPESIDNAINKNVKVLISVDCGISNCETAEYALDKDIDLIITDHHKDAREELPRAYAVVNPNRRDEDLSSPLTKLAGVGVAFALALKVKNLLPIETPSLYPLLQFVAIGTICDLAYLNPMNMKLVRHGLKQLPKTNFQGLLPFLPPEERKLDMLPSEKLSFNIGPLINSKGRLDHPEQALKLITCDNTDEAYPYFHHLEACNNERKFIQNQVFSEAKKQVISQMNGEDMEACIVYSPDWHEGVIGIVASKLVETFKVPAIVLTNAAEEGLIKGSARACGELSIFDALNSCKNLFTKFGGHKAAAGLSMPKDNLVLFKTKFTENLQAVPLNLRTTESYYDIEVNYAEVTPSLAKQISKLEPFGMGNPKPVFKINNVYLSSYDILKDAHVRWTFNHPDHKHFLKGISFFYVGKWNAPAPEELYKVQQNTPLNILGEIGINRFNGREYLQILVNEIGFNL